MASIRSTAKSLSLLLLLVGCERPQVPASTQQLGPPKVVIVELKSDQGKELLAARKKFHENFAPEKTQLPPANAEQPAAVSPPSTPADAPAAPSSPPSQPAAEPNVPGGSTPAAAPPAVPATPPMDPAQGPATGITPAGPPGSAPETPAATPSGPSGAPAADVRQVPAAGEAGRKGKEFGSGLIATPIGVYFGAREKIAILQMEEQLKLWSTQHERAPRDYKEFTEVIINPANIKLPELRPGERYIFDPKQGPHGTLLIEQRTEQPK